MNSPLAPRTNRPRGRRKLAAAFGSLGLASTLAFSGLVGEGVQQTEAAWTDTERATAEVEASWPEAFASVVAGSARSADTMENTSSNMTYQSQFRWTTQLAQPAITPTQEDTTGWATRNRIWDQRYQGAGVAVDDGAPPSTPNPLGSLDPSGLALHDGPAVQAFTNPGTRTNPSNYRCLVIDESFGDSTNRSDCGLGNNFAAATNTTAASGFSIGTGRTQFTFLNAAHLYTGARCSVDSATADEPTGRIDFGQERSTTFNEPYLDYGTSTRTVWANGIQPLTNGSPSFPPSENTLSDMWTVQNILGVSTHAKVMPVITQYSSAAGTQPYAISEISAYVEVYRRAAALSPIELHGKMHFVLSRSECGVKRVEDSAFPTQRNVFPATLPGGNGLTPYSGAGFQPASQPAPPVTARGLQQSEATTSDLAPGTTVTSPTEHTSASETTTSAPPNPDDADESTSGRTRTSRNSTSATDTSTRSSTSTRVPRPSTTNSTTTQTSTAQPAIIIPDEPGDLPSAARAEEVGTVDVGNEEHDVVVRGTRATADARTAATALDIWINDGTQPAGDWTTFTSDDPDDDGWRWAAINQDTGTIVYIR